MIPLSVMTFNLRYGNANDGDHSWEHRKAVVIQLLDKYRPHIVGTQEGLDFQLAYITSNLKDYQWFGRSRSNNPKDEHCALLYDASRISLQTGGNFWLSETPDLPGTKSWDSSLPRMVTWGRFLMLAHKRELLCLNTHFDHRGVIARQKSAVLVWRRVQGFDPELPLFLTGDFNTVQGEKTWDFFTGRETLEEERANFIDAWNEAPIRTGGVTTTYHGFRGEATEQERWQGGRWINRTSYIDWILCRPGVRAKYAAIVTDHQEERYPSDHYPVYVEFELPSA